MSTVTGSIKVAEQTSDAAIFIKAPAAEQKLKTWKSIIHWPEMSHLFVTVGRRTFLQWRVPVSCGVCGKRRDSVLNGVTQSGELSEKNLTTSSAIFTGLCRACVSRRCRLGAKMPDGSELSPLELTEDGAPIICGKCNAAQFLRLNSSVDIEDFTWQCVNCQHNIGEVKHPTGARIFWLKYWLRRVLGDVPGVKTIPFDCANCGNRYRVYPQRVWLKGQMPKKAWRGLCLTCQKTTPLLGKTGKITGDMCLIPFRSVVRYSRRKGDGHRAQVLVECGLRSCQKENWFNVYSTRHKGFTGYCVTHTFQELITRSPSQAQNGNGQQNGGAEKRGQGRPPKPTKAKRAEVEQLLTRIRDTLLELKTEGRDKSEATANLVAGKLNIGGTTGGNLMMEQVRRGGIVITWTKLRAALWQNSTEIQMFFVE